MCRLTISRSLSDTPLAFLQALRHGPVRYRRRRDKAVRRRAGHLTSVRADLGSHDELGRVAGAEHDRLSPALDLDRRRFPGLGADAHACAVDPHHQGVLAVAHRKRQRAELLGPGGVEAESVAGCFQAGEAALQHVYGSTTMSPLLTMRQPSLVSSSAWSSTTLPPSWAQRQADEAINYP
jgi:hypothetical protein